MWVIAVIIIIYLIDKLLCLSYCVLKKKKDKVVLEKIKDSNKYRDEDYSSSSQYHSGIKYWIKQLMAGWVRYTILRLGKFPCHCYRNIILKYIYQMNIGKKVIIYGGFEFRSPWNISIGDGTIIGNECKLDGRNGICIGKNVNLSTGVWIWTEQHDVNDAFFRSNTSGGTVVIGNRAWLSSRTIILPGIEIGEGSILAAGGVLTKNMEAYGIYGGVPAKKIGERTHNLQYEFDGRPLPFF